MSEVHGSYKALYEHLNNAIKEASRILAKASQECEDACWNATGREPVSLPDQEDDNQEKDRCLYDPAKECFLSQYPDLPPFDRDRDCPLKKPWHVL